jgi:hypothetical protein
MTEVDDPRVDADGMRTDAMWPGKRQQASIYSPHAKDGTTLITTLEIWRRNLQLTVPQTRST